MPNCGYWISPNHSVFIAECDPPLVAFEENIRGKKLAALAFVCVHLPSPQHVCTFTKIISQHKVLVQLHTGVQRQADRLLTMQSRTIVITLVCKNSVVYLTENQRKAALNTRITMAGKYSFILCKRCGEAHTSHQYRKGYCNLRYFHKESQQPASLVLGGGDGLWRTVHPGYQPPPNTLHESQHELWFIKNDWEQHIRHLCALSYQNCVCWSTRSSLRLMTCTQKSVVWEAKFSNSQFQFVSERRFGQSEGWTARNSSFRVTSNIYDVSSGNNVGQQLVSSGTENVEILQ